MSTTTLPQTVGQLAGALGLPPWRVRRVVDDLVGRDCPRIGPFRVIPADLAERVEAELRRRGFLSNGGPDRAE